ncbi:MAG: MBL fold metallo-hydrolase [Proteobacteria bacterium]|jgi:glyoxylase-like metal-dependent hydrolase (beta-lactamase superfamily II)|nr:MBL fold metallo-hydrolase [Ramlibacter sp.]MCA0213761.1 MBL fold metallo-hydrolase [Pseudomonadota bacterium]
MDRRGFLGAGMAGAAALTFSSVWSQSTPNFGAPAAPAVGFKRMKLGAMEVIALNDGALRRPLGEEFVTNAPLEQVKALLASQGLPTDYVDIPFTPFVIVAGGRRILMDTGFADNGPPSAGKLVANMAAAGLKPDDIDTIILSHYHGDHINGIRNKAGQLVFPKARIMVPAPEHAFWMDDARMEAAPPAMKGAFQNVRRVLAGLPADQLVRFEPGAEVAPGITSVAAFGHTPGHTLFTVKSEGQSFAYVADLTNVPSLFARSPDWSVTFDMDKEMARATRRKIFDMIVKDKMMAGGFHFPFPAFGSIEAAGNGYQFKPLA